MRAARRGPGGHSGGGGGVHVPPAAVVLTAGLLLTSLLAILSNVGPSDEDESSVTPLFTRSRPVSSCCCGGTRPPLPLSTAAAAAVTFTPRAAREVLAELRAGGAPGQCDCPGSSRWELRIPRLLHHIYLPNATALLNASLVGSGGAKLRPEWPLSCVRAYHDWRHVYWDEGSAQALLKEHVPHFLPTYLDFKDSVRRSDFLRYAIMALLGGMYLDADVQCLRPAADLLAGHDVVLQGTTAEEPLTNGVLASVPGHPLWAEAMRLAVHRFKLDPGMLVVAQTGPGALRAAAEDLGMEPTDVDALSPLAGVHLIEGGSVRVHRMGTFFTPCLYNDADCHRRLALQMAAGTVTASVAGYHRFTASWLPYGNPKGLFSEKDVERAVVTSAEGSAVAAQAAADAAAEAAAEADAAAGVAGGGLGDGEGGRGGGFAQADGTAAQAQAAGAFGGGAEGAAADFAQADGTAALAEAAGAAIGRGGGGKGAAADFAQADGTAALADAAGATRIRDGGQDGGFLQAADGAAGGATGGGGAAAGHVEAGAGAAAAGAFGQQQAQMLQAVRDHEQA